MNSEISREIEARLIEEAQRQGVSVDALLAHLMDQHAALSHPVQARPELPVWNLGGLGPLHRRDIYDDAC